MRSQYACLLIVGLLGCSLAKPATVVLGYQDSLGQYSFGYSAPGSARSEVRTLNGATKGAYSYVDGNGVIQSAQYQADGENGFRVVATNLPEAPLPVEETPEVAAARVAHLQALELAEREAASENPVKQEEEDKESITTKCISDGKAGLNGEAQLLAEEEEAKETEAVEVVAAQSPQFINAPIILIPSQLLLPPFLRQQAVPIYRVAAEGGQEIEPSNSVEELLKAQASSATPAGTALKSEGNAGSAASRQLPVEERPKVQEEKAESLKIFELVNGTPLTSFYSNFAGYAPTLSYVTYAVS